MQPLGRPVRVAIALLFLLLSLCIYLAFVHPQSEENQQRFTSLANTSGILLDFLESEGTFPTHKTISKMSLYEEDLRNKLLELVNPPPTGEGLEGDLEAIFREWGYASDGPVARAITGFRDLVGQAMGSGEEERAASVTLTLAACICRAGIEDVEKIACLPLKRASLSRDENLLTIPMDIAFNAGMTEAFQLIESWIFSSGSGAIIRPERVSIKRIEPNLWKENLESYSGPPVHVELGARIIYSASKGLF